MPVAVSYGGSPGSLVEWMRALPGVMVARRVDSLVGQVRASIAKAHGTGRPFILYTEPDKRQFFADGLPDFVARASVRRSIGVQLAARSESALGTFPPFQRLAEASASDLCRRAIGADLDYFYGPFLIRRELARLVSGASNDLGWGWRPFLFVAARRRGFRVVGIPGDYECPPGQRREDRRDQEHRLRQFSDNVRGLLEGVIQPHVAPPSRV
jgi:hypothetical protein